MDASLEKANYFARTRYQRSCFLYLSNVEDFIYKGSHGASLRWGAYLSGLCQARKASRRADDSMLLQSCPGALDTA